MSAHLDHILAFGGGNPPCWGGPAQLGLALSERFSALLGEVQGMGKGDTKLLPAFENVFSLFCM